jgi:hypothetical protein
MKIIDNFLPQDFFNDLQNLLFDDKFPWYFSNISVYEGDDSPMFVHIVYMDMEPVSSLWEQIKSTLIEKLQLKRNQSILRIKINATPRTSSIEETGLHYDIISDRDQSVRPHNVAIIYLNSNDGYTIFEDGTKVESVENRCVIFPGSLKHAGTSCTDTQLRMVLNINYTIDPDDYTNTSN